MVSLVGLTEGSGFKFWLSGVCVLVAWNGPGGGVVMCVG